MTTETTPGGWTVLDRETGVLTRSYDFRRNAQSSCFVARMGNGQLVVVSPPTGLDEAAYAELSAFGDVGAIVANNGFHHLGQPAWRARFPNARAFAPAAAIGRIKKQNPAAGELEPLEGLTSLLGSDVGIREVPNTRMGESWVWARTRAGHAWYVSDVLANMPTLPPKQPVRALFWATRSAPGYRPFNLALLAICKDRRGALGLLRDDLKARPASAVVPAHGDLLLAGDVAGDTDRAVARGL